MHEILELKEYKNFSDFCLHMEDDESEEIWIICSFKMTQG